MRRLLVWLSATVLATAAMAAGADEDFYFDETTPVPASVLSLQDCGADEHAPAHRKPFAGGYIFAIQCASNNENFIEVLIFAEHEDGADAHLLLFPGPGQAPRRFRGAALQHPLVSRQERDRRALCRQRS